MVSEKATFAAGCFWGVEAAFRAVPGVISTRVGYTGGTTVRPTYEQVCSGRTGHAEAVEICYDPDVVSYQDLLSVFWAVHDPTQKDRQGPDHGTQYRSVIFCHSPAQESAARISLAAQQTSSRWQSPVVTEILSARPFYPAEEYHQQFLEKNPGMGCGHRR